MPSLINIPPWYPDKWEDIPSNPLIYPLSGDPRCGVGDPQIILPGEFDERWHMFFHGHPPAGHGRFHFYHYTSSDGINWKLAYHYPWHCGPCYITSTGEEWIVYYTHAVNTEEYLTRISARTSRNLVDWSDPVEILVPEKAWEREGNPVEVRNPCAILLPNKKWRLYYSGGTIWLSDCGYEEPKYIGYAEADHPLGLFKKAPNPIIKPDPDVWYRNFGAGGIKVFGYESGFIALENGMYVDRERRSRSAICLLASRDGITWHDAPFNPIIPPAKQGWKKGLVYQLDLRWFKNALWLFYNARDGWKEGREYIGCSRLVWDGPIPQKLWNISPGEADSTRKEGTSS